MSRIIQNAIRASQNYNRNDLVVIKIKEDVVGTYDPLSGERGNTSQVLTTVRVTRQSISTSELTDSKIRFGDTKLLIQSQKVKDVRFYVDMSVEVNGVNMTLKHSYLDPSNSLYIIYVR